MKKKQQKKEHWVSAGTITVKGATDLRLERTDATHWRLMSLVPVTTISLPRPRSAARAQPPGEKL